MKIQGLPELLCPAGSPAALAAAIEGGADAVYLGGAAFNARMGAKNFTLEELREGIALAHAYGKKVYITANTAIFDRELSDFLHAAEDAYLCGADALIVADLGAARQIRQRIPIALHASTQCAGHNAEAARLLAELGFSRMVCAREMSREQLSLFVDSSPIEAEVFVHGALCVCHSGQCLFSSLVGGRSGNRGECAQPCRLPFTKDKKTSYPLSLKDLSLARHVPELMELGIASLKIEGRMKSPEYVRDVTAVWRRLLDEGRGADDREMACLAAIFSRGGFTDGYYTARIDRKMLGIRSEGDKQSSRDQLPFAGLSKKIPLSLFATLQADMPIALTLRGEDGRSVTVTGEVPQPARTAPLTREGVEKNLTKLGNTPYFAQSVSVTLDEGLMVPVSQLNTLRRAAIEAFENTAEARSAADFRPLERKTGRASQKAQILSARTAVFYEADSIPQEAFGYFDRIFTPLEAYDPRTNGVILPPVIPDDRLEEIKRLLARSKKRGAIHALFGNAGHLSLIKEAGLVPHGNMGLNVTNGESAALWQSLGVETLLISPELTLPQMRDIHGPCGGVVYGRIPLMVTEKCVGKELGSCESCQAGRTVLTDRKGVDFPVLRAWEHRSLILNSVPVYMADRQQELDRAGLAVKHFVFTVESREQVRQILSAYQNHTPPMTPVRRMK